MTQLLKPSNVTFEVQAVSEDTEEEDASSSVEGKDKENGLLDEYIETVK